MMTEFTNAVEAPASASPSPVNCIGGPTLPEPFSSPSNYDVIIGRGRRVAQHPGNIRFRALIQAELEEYSLASKTGKSSIIRRVVNQIRQESPLGVGFVKENPNNTKKRWAPVEDTAARQNTAQAFRDALSGIYRSSKKAKSQIRVEKLSHSGSNSNSNSGSNLVAMEQQQNARMTSYTQKMKKVGPSVKYSQMIQEASRMADYHSKLSTTKLVPQDPTSVPLFASTGGKGTSTSVIHSNFGVRMEGSSWANDNDWRLTETLSSINTAVGEQENHNLAALFDKLASSQEVEWTENPFEPRPIMPGSSALVSSHGKSIPSSDLSPLATPCHYKLERRHETRTQDGNKIFLISRGLG